MSKTIRSNWMKRVFSRRGAAIFMCFFMIAYLITGLISVPDYGEAADEQAQRRHALINYKYINKALLNRNISALVKYHNLETYDRYYGVALQIPVIFYEDLHHFQLLRRDVSIARHYYIFCICFIGYLFFYLALRRIFPDSTIIPVLGTLMICLYPRYYGGQFTDIKNRLFSAMCMITLFFMVMAVEKRKIQWEIGFGCVAALAVNSRMMGSIFPVLLVVYWLCVDLTDAVLRKKNSIQMIHPDESPGKRAGKYLTVGISFFLSWFLITPKAWTENPVHTFIATFHQFSNFEAWKGTMVFMGKLITCEEIPWYYQYLWIAITVPILFLILFAIGHYGQVRSLARKGFWLKLLTEHKWFACSMGIFWGSTLAAIIFHSRIYVGWHHVYYVFVPMVVLMCFGLQHLMQNQRMKYVVGVALAINLVWLGIWNVNHHLWETAFFNSIGSQFAEYFDRGETQPAGLSLARWILDQEDGVVSLYWQKSNYGMLTADEKARLKRTQGRGKADYCILNYRNVIGNNVNYEGFEEVHTVWINRYKVGSVFKRITE